MDIKSMTVGEAMQIAAMFGATKNAGASAYDALVGRGVFVRAVTNHFTGRLVAVTDGELVIEDAAWIADSGRWSSALVSGVLGEIEPYPDGRVIVSRGAVVDVCEWPHALPRGVK